MRKRFRNEVLTTVWAIDIFDGIGGATRFYVQSTDEKGALLKVFKSIIDNKYYHVEEVADPILDQVED